MHADLDCLFPPVAAAASTGSERRPRQIRIADSSFAVGDLHLAGDTARAFSHRSFRAAQPYADCPGVLPLPCPLSREPFRSSCPSFRMESALPYCSLLQTNLSPCPCPCGTGPAQQQFSPSVPPLHSKLFGAPERTLSSRSLRSKIAVAQRRAAVTAGRCRGRKGRSPKAKGSSS